MKDEVKKIFRLYENDMIVYELRITSDNGLIGNLYDQHNSPSDEPEYSFIANVYIKFDMCSHWNFYGTDYNSDNESEKDSYYHICGGHEYIRFFRAMAFAAEVACIIHSKNSGYFDNEELKEIRSLHLLEGFEIKQVL